MLCLTPEEEEIIKDGGVFYNGGCICCNGQKVYTTIPANVVRRTIKIINTYQDINFAVQMSYERHSFRYGLTDEDYSLWGVNKDKLISFQSLKYMDVIKIVVFSPWDRLLVLQNELVDAVGTSANVYLTGRSDFKSIEIVSKTINKKLAVGTMLFDGVKQLVNHIENKGLKCGIVSTKFRCRIEEILNGDGFAGRFNIIIGGEDVSNNKPDPEGLLKAIDILKINKSDCLYVGDSIVDAKTAINAGVDFVAVLSGTTARDEGIIPTVKEMEVMGKEIIS